MSKDKPGRIEITAQEVNHLIERGEKRSFTAQDYLIVVAVLRNYFALHDAYQEKSRTILRFLSRIFGRRTEKAKDVLKGALVETPPDSTTPPPDEPAKAKRKGHGRNGASSYPAAQKITVPHSDYKAGDGCPLCSKGKLYRFYEPGVEIRIVGRPPLEATIYEVEKLRCNLCGEILTAPVPEASGKDKYDETAGAMVALLKYGTGLPFHRMEKLHESLGVPLPASTQWEIVEKAADKIHPVYNELIRQAAQSQLLHSDDTTMKILANDKEPKGEDDTSGKGSFTTGVLGVKDEREIALFFTGKKHAGQNMADLLKQRAADLGPPIHMCDALSRNITKEFETILANCLTHGRRNFVDLASSFPEECRSVIESLAQVYHHDKTAKEQGFSPEQRLRFHQAYSGPVMARLKEWLQNQFDQRKVEPNSSMGKAITYMLKHWEPLTLFLRIPGAPLDNNICERALKRAILHRKNSLFFKTQHGAYIGDLFMSLIHTCTLNRVNPFHYLTTLQKHSSELFIDPKSWLPWNYQHAKTNPL
jgi:transposase